MDTFETHWIVAVYSKLVDDPSTCDVAHWFDADIAQMLTAPYPSTEPYVCSAQLPAANDPIIVRPAA